MCRPTVAFEAFRIAALKQGLVKNGKPSDALITLDHLAGYESPPSFPSFEQPQRAMTDPLNSNRNLPPALTRSRPFDLVGM
ncbi:hypothetical protein AJ88_13940 [Mesorhizobium amorphae CCBAU 01583]|nr:hypothetical protein AJ88_13940 [Mesorhizobium amorphae CCBAU 01583]